MSFHRLSAQASHPHRPADRDTFSPLLFSFLCMTLLACNVSVMAWEGDKPNDQRSDSTVVDLSFDGIGEPAFDLALFFDETVASQDSLLQDGGEETEGEEGASGSNPLASVSKLDLVWTLTGAGGSQTHDVSAEGAFMLNPRIKFVYEAHYFQTDITGSNENDWESIHLKPIYFPLDKKLNDEWMMRVAVGAEYIHSFDNVDQGIGADSDIIAPLFGMAFAKPAQGLTLIPLTQHFLSFNGTSVNATAFRLIGLQALPDGYWLKLDAKILVDWHHDTTPIDSEIEFGRMLNPNLGLFCKGLFGVGNDRFFDWGVAAGVRFNF